MCNDVDNIDPVWEEKYSTGHEERYPWDSIVSFVYRNYPRGKSRNEVKILEVGCGTGSNLWFAAREGFNVTGFDGSESAIKKARKRFQEEGLIGDFRVCDFASIPYENDIFDLVIDRGALTCAGFEVGKVAIREIHRVIRTGGLFYFNPYSDVHSSSESGDAGEDGLRHNISEGSMIGVGKICFYAKNNVLEALRGWEIHSIQHLERAETHKPERMVHAEWRAIASK